MNWFEPSGNGRHHTLPVCLSYRGRNVVPEASCDGVFHDDELWLAEAFLMPDGVLCDYREYLKRTLVPFSHPGIHLIASARRNSLDARQFSGIAWRHFEQVKWSRKTEPVFY